MVKLKKPPKNAVPYEKKYSESKEETEKRWLKELSDLVEERIAAEEQ